MSHITHADLIERGLKLNKFEAMSLQSHITRIALNGADEAEEVYTPTEQEEESAVPADEQQDDDKPKRGRKAKSEAPAEEIQEPEAAEETTPTQE